MSIRINDWFVAGNAQKTNSDWNAESGYAQILNKPTNLAHTTGNETFGGIKTFSSIPQSVTPNTNSNDTSVATTQFVNNKISSHDNNTSSHADIRQAITTTNSNIENSISSHNINSSSHSDIRQAITTTNSNISSAVESHNLNSASHNDIRQVLTTNSNSITALINDLTDETTNRNADVSNLQQQIDALSSKGDVADIVGTYQDLLNYDTSTLLNKSIIKVLTDETHDDASSYYKWNTNTSSFNYIGSEAPTYNKTEIDDMYTNSVHKTGNDAISGTKTLNGSILLGSTGSINGLSGTVDVQTQTAGDSSTKAASTAFVTNAISTQDSGVVHTTGDETINGTKRFNKCINRYIDSSEAIVDNSWHSLDTIDTYTGSSAAEGISCGETGTYRFCQLSRSFNNINYTALLNFHLREGSAYLDLTSSANTTVSNTTTNTDSTTSNVVATFGWVNNPATSLNVVHRTGNESITGTKTFTSTIYVRDNSYVYAANSNIGDVTRASQEINRIGWQDNSSNSVSLIQEEYHTDGTRELGVCVRNNTNNGWEHVLRFCTPTYSETSSSSTVIANNSWTFNETINGTAYRALWADLAENYLTDKPYPKGTLVQFGGEKEITIAKNKVNAVITSEPGFVLNGEMEGSQAIALIGRVPVRVIGKVKKFDKIALSYIDGVGCVSNDSENYIGIALVNKDDSDEGLVLCSVRIDL